MYAVTNNLPTAMLTKKAKTSDVGSVVNLGGELFLEGILVFTDHKVPTSPNSSSIFLFTV